MTFTFNKFKVGDVAYYRSPESKYCVRKAKVCHVEKEMRRVGHIFFPYYMITLENGMIMPSSMAFVTRKEAMAYLVEELNTRLIFQQVQLDNLQHEMAYEAAVLKRSEKKPTIKVEKHNFLHYKLGE